MAAVLVVGIVSVETGKVVEFEVGIRAVLAVVEAGIRVVLAVVEVGMLALRRTGEAPY